MIVLNRLTQNIKSKNHIDSGHLADGTLTVVADGEITLGGLVGKHLRVERGEKLKLHVGRL